MNNEIQTFSGGYFNFRAPETHHFDIYDIAHALSNICRFTGHTSSFYCPTPDQRILTEDLEWVPAGDLRVGDRLFAFDENPVELGAAGKARRRMRPSVVTHAQAVKRPIIRLELEDGSCVRASAEHPWLIATKVSRNQKWMTSTEIAVDLAAGRRRYMHKFLEPWETSVGWKAGWLSGIFDGEGYLSAKNRSGTQLGVAQKPGVVLNQIEEFLDDFGFSYGASATGDGRSGVVSLQLRGGWRECVRLLGSFKPIRLLQNFRASLAEGHFAKQLDGASEPLLITKAWVEDAEWVAGLETSTHTYFCEGFGAHNCVAQHSVLVSMIVPPSMALKALLHDAAEAYLGDVSAPLKAVLPDYKAIENRVERALLAHFGVDPTFDPIIKHADLRALVTESRDLMARPIEIPGAEPTVYSITPLSPGEAALVFLQRFHELMQVSRTPRDLARCLGDV